MKTLTEYAPHVRATFEKLLEIQDTQPVARTWFDAINDATKDAPLSLKNFLSNHDILNTLQVKFSGHEVTGVWSPGAREVSTHSTYAKFDGSRRDFAGVVHIAHNTETWLGFDKDTETIIAYSAI